MTAVALVAGFRLRRMLAAVWPRGADYRPRHACPWWQTSQYELGMAAAARQARTVRWAADPRPWTAWASPDTWGGVT